MNGTLSPGSSIKCVVGCAALETLAHREPSDCVRLLDAGGLFVSATADGVVEWMRKSGLGYLSLPRQSVVDSVVSCLSEDHPIVNGPVRACGLLAGAIERSGKFEKLLRIVVRSKG